MQKLRAGIVLGVSLAVAQAWAVPPPPNVPNTFAIQGVLRDGQGRLQSKMVTVIAALYNDATATAAGNKLAGPYGPFHVMAVNGLFTVRIDDTALVTELAAQSAGVWLDVTVDSDSYPRQQVTPEIYAVMASQADSLSTACSGCVVDSMIGNVAFGKITGVVNATQLNGKADTSFEPALTNVACAAGSFYSSISGGGAVTCGGAVTSLALSGGLAQTAGTAGAVNLSINSTIQRAFASYTDGSSSSASACPAGSALSGATGAGAVTCVNTVTNATNATTATTATNATTADGMSAACAAANGGKGCISTAQINDQQVTAAKIANNTITASEIANTTITAAKIANNTITATQIATGTLHPTLTITIPNPAGTSTNIPSNSCSTGFEVCDSCPAGQNATGGGCSLVINGGGGPTTFINNQGVNPLFPSPNPAPSPNPEAAGVQTQYCCYVNSNCGPNTATLTARVNCLQLNAIP